MQKGVGGERNNIWREGDTVIRKITVVVYVKLSGSAGRTGRESCDGGRFGMWACWVGRDGPRRRRGMR